MTPVKDFCKEHGQVVAWLMPRQVCALRGVCRQTVSNWMNHGWVHILEQPSGRRLVCELSLGTHRRPEEESLPKKRCPQWQIW